MDMSEKLWQVYNRLDPVSLNQVLTEVRSGTRVPANENVVNSLTAVGFPD